MVVCDGLRTQEPDLYCDGAFELVSRWDRCIAVLWDCAEMFSGTDELHLTL